VERAGRNSEPHRYDLKQHSQHSGKALEHSTKSRNKIALAASNLQQAIDHWPSSTLIMSRRVSERVVSRFHAELAPLGIAVLPLLKKNDRSSIRRKLTADLRRRWHAVYDAPAFIGRSPPG
jgi:glycyl-tRNA synthetase (class II)